ncbi:MAG: glycosyltransferase family 2 protein [Coprococcus sp.]
MCDLISVIVPIYNVEKYIRKCVDSIINQTYKNLEIILVDDGSPDGCGKICDEYERIDSRIVVIHKKNGGLSDARNAGLEVMHGKYVAFVDSDDWIESEMYQRLYENMMTFHADMSFGGVTDDIIDEKGIEKSVKISNYGNTPFAENKIAAMKRYFHGSWAAWDKLYRASLFDDVKFPVGEINEDEAIVIELLEQCDRVCYTNEVFYHYIKRENSGSITMSDFSKKKLAWQDHCANNLKIIQEKYPELEKDAAVRYRNSLLWSLTEIALSNSNEDFKQEIEDLIEKLKKNKKLFLEAEHLCRTDRIRIKLLSLLGFGFYKKIIRMKRKNKR